MKISESNVQLASQSSYVQRISESETLVLWDNRSHLLFLQKKTSAWIFQTGAGPCWLTRPSVKPKILKIMYWN